MTGVRSKRLMDDDLGLGVIIVAIVELLAILVLIMVAWLRK